LNRSIGRSVPTVGEYSYQLRLLFAVLLVIKCNKSFVILNILEFQNKFVDTPTNLFIFALELMNINADREIWEDFLKGEDYALSHIYYQHIQGLYRYGKKFTNDDELVKDTIQELFFDLIRTRKNLCSTDNINFYLIASFRRKLAKSIRKSKIFSNTSDEEFFKAEIEYSIERELIEKEE